MIVILFIMWQRKEKGKSLHKVLDKIFAGAGLAIYRIAICMIQESKHWAHYPLLISIKIPHFLYPEQGLSFERWKTFTYSLTFSHLSFSILFAATYLTLLWLSVGWSSDTEKKPMIYYWIMISFLLTPVSLLLLFGLLDCGSILPLARSVEFFKIANWLDQESILSYILLLQVGSASHATGLLHCL